MTIYTSYFYQIRNMNKYIIPLSTAVWDPKWFHDNKKQDYVYKDKNGVFIGLRAEIFVPGAECSGLCRGPETCLTKNPNRCEFLYKYKEQLDKLDFGEVLRSLTNFSKQIRELENLDKDPDIALIFHEAPDNPCSERVMVHQWFYDNGYDIPEFNK